MQREIGRWDSGRPGPTLLVIAGVHGNEPAGVVAAQRVVAHLQERAPVVRGRFAHPLGRADLRLFAHRDALPSVGRHLAARSAGSLFRADYVDDHFWLDQRRLL